MSSSVAQSQVADEGERFTVTVDPPVHGSLSIVPPLPEDGRVPAGTELTLTASPDEGYVVDSVYYSFPGRWGAMYYESLEREWSVTIDRDQRVGASFIERSAVEHVNVTHNVQYAQPGVKPLKYDVYSPQGAENLPCIVIIHGGGWSTNTEDIMRGLARELTRGGQFVVASIDYRWAGRLDGDETGSSMADLIEDVFGAIVHIREHAAEYGADPNRIGLTGDSAGGHLSAAASLMPYRIGDGGFGKTEGVFEFRPSYMPAGKSLEQVRTELMTSIKAAAPSYGVFGGRLLNHYSEDPAADDTWKDAVAPINDIPPATERKVPQFLLRGTLDFLIRDEEVAAFRDALQEAGQVVEYLQVKGAGHAFFDWKPDSQTKATFAEFGLPYAAKMKVFFAEHL